MNYLKLFRGAPMAFASVFLLLAIFLLSGAVGGEFFQQQALVSLGNVVMSYGIFAVGIPACLLLVKRKSISAELFFLAIGLYIFIGSLAVYFIFGAGLQNYFGLEALPEKSKILYLAGLAASIAVALLYLVQAWPREEKKFSKIGPFVLLFIAVGLSLGNLTILVINVLLPSESFLEVTMYLSDIVRRLVVAGAVGQILLYLVKQVPEKEIYAAFSMMGSLLYVLGFQVGALRGGANDIVYILHQLFHALGLALILMSAGNLLFSIWQKKTLSILNGGAWVSHSLFLVSLILLFISQGPLAATVLGGVHSSLPILLLVIAVPLMLQLRSEESLPKTSAAHISTALIWCGLLVSLMTLVLMAPLGAHFTFAGMAELKPLMGLLIGGMSMILLSLMISFWEIILVEYI